MINYDLCLDYEKIRDHGLSVQPIFLGNYFFARNYAPRQLPSFSESRQNDPQLTQPPLTLLSDFTSNIPQQTPLFYALQSYSEAYSAPFPLQHGIGACSHYVGFVRLRCVVRIGVRCTIYYCWKLHRSYRAVDSSRRELHAVGYR